MELGAGKTPAGFQNVLRGPPVGRQNNFRGFTGLHGNALPHETINWNAKEVHMFHGRDRVKVS